MANNLTIQTPIAFNDLAGNLGRKVEEVSLTIAGNHFDATKSTALSWGLMLAPQSGREIGTLTLADNGIKLQDATGRGIETVAYEDVSRVEVGVLQSLSRYSSAVLPYRHFWTFIEITLRDTRVLQFINANLAAAPVLLTYLKKQAVREVVDPFELVDLTATEVSTYVTQHFESQAKLVNYPVTVAGLGN
ncbi:hypothetical protein WDV13_03030 [Weissella cibaria]|uniref:hypothetical protein n=1 Tax=Weissella cibaria TaxID=137591 RepID=UPI000E5433F4|nr:hypothetical protein [Weissella cibaria]MCQ9620504.1 hypothetical protein [Weissella cibaria]RGO80805.1 hypothetical protein DXA89_02270 [Weissella cibaria]RHE70998.1 hypothetical protein DW718_08135 [Weissella cibaria]RHE76642.1 hypothetical protein DW717_08490 [Weissella cibaria]